MEDSVVNDDTTPKVEEVKPTHQPAQENIDDIKVIAALSYLGILFFLPMIIHPKSKFAMFHANQGLLLLISAAAINIVGGAIPILGWIIILPIGNIFVFVLFIMGLIAALNGQQKRLPLIGKYDLLKPQEDVPPAKV